MVDSSDLDTKQLSITLPRDAAEMIGKVAIKVILLLGKVL
jgi:hypothetical protein